MRIAFLDSWLRQAFDGSGTAVAIGGLERALRVQGHQVSRLGPTKAWPHNLTARRLLWNLQLPLLLRHLPYDLIVGFDIDGVLHARLPRTAPYLCSVKGVIAEELRHERGTVRRLLWSLSLLEGANARAADGVLTTSAYCRAKIAEHYGVDARRIGLVPEGIDLAAWQAQPSAHDDRTVLCVARQYPRKHVADLIRAFAQVRRVLPRARLVVIGDGPEHPRLQQLVGKLQLHDNVQLLGALPDDVAVRAYYRRAAVFCLPSVQEGFGIVLLEAMASGLPIVATTAAAVPEVVPHGQAGLLVPPGDPEALAEALIALLCAPELRAEMGAWGAEYVARYEWRRVAERFLAEAAQFVATSTRPA